MYNEEIIIDGEIPEINFERFADWIFSLSYALKNEKIWLHLAISRLS